MSLRARLTLLALGVCLVLPAPALASEVLVVGPHGVKAREDPYLPPRSVTDLPPPGPGASPTASASKRGPTVRRALRDAFRGGDITRDQYVEYRDLYKEARSARSRLSGARRTELGAVIKNLERISRAELLTPSRMPALFLILERNTRFWLERAFPGGGRRLSFGRDPVIFQYYPGQGLQIQPLANFSKANTLYNACVGAPSVKPGTPCRERSLRRLLDRLVELKAQRSDFTTWEYYFRFGGGSPPWTSGLSQGTAIQALSRSSDYFQDPSYLDIARGAIGVFQHRPPVGVRVRGKGGGNHYLIYSFSRRLRVINAFLQSLIGLYDFAKIADDETARGLFEAGDRSAKVEIPFFDTGAWVLYSLHGAEATQDYEALTRTFLRNLCDRTSDDVYCNYGERFDGYLHEDPEIDILGSRHVKAHHRALFRFHLSKISRVSLRIRKGGRVVFIRKLTFPYGKRAFRWTPPSRGRYRFTLVAADLNSHHVTRKGTIRATG
jgi:D-glucuronyl C5-epimerase-like protein